LNICCQENKKQLPPAAPTGFTNGLKIINEKFLFEEILMDS